MLHVSTPRNALATVRQSAQAQAPPRIRVCGRHAPVPALVDCLNFTAERQRSRHVTGQQRLQQSKRRVDTGAFGSSLVASTQPAWSDAGWFLIAGVGAWVWTKLFDFLVTNGVLEQKLSRKLVHITTGPIFLLTWPLFSLNPWARFFAAAVPGLNMIRILTVGLGVLQDKGLVASVSRSGDKSELLKGPLYYALILMLVTLICWRDDPTGIVAVCLMCGGDGLADIVGRRWGQDNKLPFNPSKSWAGSLAMMIGGTVMAAGLLTVFCKLGYCQRYALEALLPCLLAVGFVSTVVEALPLNQVLDDNLTVPVVAAGVAMMLMPHAATASIPVLAAL